MNGVAGKVNHKRDEADMRCYLEMTISPCASLVLSCFLVKGDHF
jgi:hypothetical protein